MESENYFTIGLIGKIFRYNEAKNICYSNEVDSTSCIIFVGGLGSNLLNPRYISQLNTLCIEMNIRLLIPQFESHPKFQIVSIDKDIDNLHDIIMYAENKFKTIVLIGHSTGCQDCLLFIRKYCISKIKGIILQAPVSDVEGMEIMVPNLNEYIAKAHENKYIEFENTLWLSERFLSLYERYNKEDLFSSWIADSSYKSFGKLCRIHSVISENDEYCFVPIISKLQLMGTVCIIKNAQHSLNEKEHIEMFLQEVKWFIESIE